MMSISAGMYEVTSRPTSCSRTAGFDQTFMTSSYFGKMPSKIGWPRRGPTHWSDDLFLGSLQSADPEHASPDRHGGYKPQAPHERKSKGLTNACAIRHLIGTRRRAYQDRKSVVLGKSVDLGGRRIIKKKRHRHESRMEVMR